MEDTCVAQDVVPVLWGTDEDDSGFGVRLEGSGFAA